MTLRNRVLFGVGEIRRLPEVVAAAGESLSGRLVMFDAKSADWRSVRVKRDPSCKVCGTR